MSRSPQERVTILFLSVAILVFSAAAALAGPLSGNVLTPGGNFQYSGQETFTATGNGNFNVSGDATYTGAIPSDADLTTIAGQMTLPFKTWIAAAAAIELGLVGTPLVENATGDLGPFGMLVASNGIHSPGGFTGDIDITGWDVAALNALDIDTTMLSIDLTVVESGPSQSTATGTFTVGAPGNELVGDMTFVYDLAPGDSFAGTMTADLEFNFPSATEQTWTGTVQTNYSSNPVPTVSEWGLVIMTVLGLTAGTILFGRRRRHAAA